MFTLLPVYPAIELSVMVEGALCRAALQNDADGALIFMVSIV